MASLMAARVRYIATPVAPTIVKLHVLSGSDMRTERNIWVRAMSATWGVIGLPALLLLVSLALYVGPMLMTQPEPQHSRTAPAGVKAIVVPGSVGKD